MLPVCSALLLLGIDGAEEHEIANNVLLPMGEYFQVQDDYLDAFGDPKVIGKIGTDIEDSKCSWLIVQVMGKATDAQMAIVKENYGSSDPAKVAKIKELYKEMGMEETYRQYENECYEKLKTLIDEQDKLPKEVFTKFLEKIFKRNK